MNYIKFVFPFAYSLNMFSITVLIVFLGLFGYSEMAADVAIVHAATLVAFMAFSGHARNSILGQDETLTFENLLKFRLILVLPLSIAAYFLCYAVLNPEAFLVYVLIIRRALEWLLELQISERELQDDFAYAKKYSFIQAFFIVILSSLILSKETNLFYIVLSVWALSPLIFLLRLFKNRTLTKSDFGSIWKRILPHLGSSWIIASSAYVFRLLIILLASKSIAGILFSAFAIGGMTNSVYTYAIGPTIARLLKDGGVKKERKYTFVVIAFLTLIGLLLIAYAFFIEQTSIINADVYLPIGLSLVGGAIMIVTQRQRIHILQLDKNSVFVPDVIINILIISSVPFSVYLFGINSLAGLFLWNAILTFAFYKIPSINIDWFRSKFSGSLVEKLLIVFNRDFIQAVIVLFLFFPLFFQLDGSFIFHSSDFIYNHGGSLAKLPLPYSIPALFLGLMLIMNNYKSVLETSILFAFFILMMFSVYVTSFNNDELLSKIIFLIQIILPVFALILGRAYRTPQNIMLKYQSMFLLVLVIIIPSQVFITLSSASDVLMSDMFFFSIYQHLQYVPTIMVVVYGVVYFSYKKRSIFKMLSIVLLPLMWSYVVFSASVAAILLMFVITICLIGEYLFRQDKQRFYKSIIMSVCLITLLISGKLMFGLFVLGDIEGPYVLTKLASDTNGLPRNLNERFEIWKMVWDGILESDKSFWFGHSERLSKDIANSAHNYYFDLIYQFGFISALPLLGLIIFTIYKFVVLFLKRSLSIEVITMGLFVLFILLIDNSLKVGLRQPYSGVVSFFLWGVLLSHLMKDKACNK